MSCTSDKALANIKYRLEALTSHTDTDTTRKGFVYYDEDKLSGELTSGMTRGFSLDWLGSSPDGEVMDLVVQQSQQAIQLKVAYYKHGDWLELQKLILRDRFDIIKCLRNPDNWTGTAEDSTAATGIDDRQLNRDEIVKTDHAAYLVQRWTHSTIESEQ